MNADGSQLRRLTDMPEAASNPSISPDGSKIVFDSGPEDRPGIWMMDRDGSRLRRIADGADPSWSPSMKNGKR
jgi:Tol biopolymer transport system component